MGDDWLMTATGNNLTTGQFIEKLRKIRAMGWMRNARPGNAGGVGNTVEDLLGIKENNLPIPDAAEWELKCRRADTNSLTTLFHMEPSPRELNIVPNILLLKYGWEHQEAGKKYSLKERSFRQTIHCPSRSDRGFKVVVDTNKRKVLISFDSDSVSPRHEKWLAQVGRKVGLGELDPQPYWEFDELCRKASTKLLNCFLLEADVRRENGVEFFSYKKIMMLKEFSLNKFLGAIQNGTILVDFDARTGHNHGTKFRARQEALPALYDVVERISQASG